MVFILVDHQSRLQRALQLFPRQACSCAGVKAVVSAEFVDDIILVAHHINDAIRASSKQPGETAIRRVLQPRYVSTVDSGNLLASLWTFETSCNELAARPLLDVDALRGIADTLGVMRQIGVTMKEAEHAPAFLRLVELTTGHAVNLEEIILRLREARPAGQDLLLFFRAHETDPRAYWAQQVAKQVAAWNTVIDKYFRPVEILMASPSQLMSLGEATHESRREALAATFSLRNIATEGIPGLVGSAPTHDRSGNAGAFHELSAQPLVALSDAQLSTLGPDGLLSIERRLRLPRPVAGCHGSCARRATVGPRAYPARGRSAIR